MHTQIPPKYEILIQYRIMEIHCKSFNFAMRYIKTNTHLWIHIHILYVSNHGPHGYMQYSKILLKNKMVKLQKIFLQ